MHDLTDEDASITATLLAELGLEIQELKTQLKAYETALRVTNRMHADFMEDRARALTLMEDAIKTIEGLAEQQAMEDNFYGETLAQLEYCVGVWQENCDCASCYNQLIEDYFSVDTPENIKARLNTSRMIVCQLCGNKRCPHASFHGNECTESNDPGQPGSFYAMVVIPKEEM